MPDRFRVVPRDIGKDFPVLCLEFLRHIPNRFNSLFRPPLGVNIVELFEGVSPLFGLAVSVWGMPLEDKFGCPFLLLGGDGEWMFGSANIALEAVVRGGVLVGSVGIGSQVVSRTLAEELEDVGVALVVVTPTRAPPIRRS